MVAAAVVVAAIRPRPRLRCLAAVAEAVHRAQTLRSLRLTWLRQKPILLALRGRRALLLAAAAAKAATPHSARAQSKSSAMAAAAVAADQRLHLLEDKAQGYPALAYPHRPLPRQTMAA